MKEHIIIKVRSLELQYFLHFSYICLKVLEQIRNTTSTVIALLLPMGQVYVWALYIMRERMLALQVLQSTHDLRTDNVVPTAFLQLTQQILVPRDVPEAAVESIQGVPTGSDEGLLPLEEEELGVRAIGGLVISKGYNISQKISLSIGQVN